MYCMYISFFLLAMPCDRSHRADSGQVLADGVGESAHDYCHAHSMCGGWQSQQLAQALCVYTMVPELACLFYTISANDVHEHTIIIY